MDIYQIARMLSENYAPPPELLGMAQQGLNIQPNQLAMAPPGPGYTAPGQFGPPVAPGGGEPSTMDLLRMLSGGGGVPMGAPLDAQAFRAPTPGMGAIGGKAQVQSQVAPPGAPPPALQSLLALLSGGR